MPDLYRLILITKEQIQELKKLNLPFCPSAFVYYAKGNFGKYKAYMRLAAFRTFGWEGSEILENNMKEHWRKYYDYCRWN